MIASLRGAVLAKSADKAVLEVAGVGYEICMTADAIARLPALGAAAFVHVAESVAMYGGGVTLYAFLSPVEKEMFRLADSVYHVKLELIKRVEEMDTWSEREQARPLVETVGRLVKSAKALVKASHDPIFPPMRKAS